MHCFTTEPFHASMFFSVVRLPIPHVICSLPALRRMSTAPWELSSISFAFSLEFHAKQCSLGIHYICVCLSLLGRVCQMGPCEIKTCFACALCGCADERRHICEHQGPAQTAYARTRQAGSHLNPSESYPNQRHGGIAAAVLSATELLAEQRR